MFYEIIATARYSIYSSFKSTIVTLFYIFINVSFCFLRIMLSIFQDHYSSLFLNLRVFTTILTYAYQVFMDLTLSVEKGVFEGSSSTTCMHYHIGI